MFFVKILLAIAALAVFITWLCHKGGERLRTEDLEYVKSDGKPRPISGQWDDENDPPEAA